MQIQTIKCFGCGVKVGEILPPKSGFISEIKYEENIHFPIDRKYFCKDCGKKEEALS